VTHPLRRTLLAAVLPATLVLAGCGGQSDQEPTSYLLTDLEGGTAAPGDVTLPEPTTTETPTDPDGPRRTPGAGSGGSGGSDAPSGDDLVALVSAAAAQVETVRVSIGNQTPPPDIEAAFVYGDTDAYDASLVITPDQPDVIFRRVEGTFYAGTAQGLEAVDPDDPRLSSVAGGVVPAFLVWNPLLDLRAALEGARDVAVGGPEAIDGVDVTSYEFELDVDDLPRPSLIVPDQATGTARVTFSVDADDLPVRLQLERDAGGIETVAVVDYSAWGERVQIEVPPAG